MFFFSHSSTFFLPRPISLMNIQIAPGVRRERSYFHLLSLILFLSLLQSSSYALNVPKVDDLVLGKVIASDIGQWKVP